MSQAPTKQRMKPREVLGWVLLVGFTLLLLWVAGVVLVVGLPFYLTPVAERPASALASLYGSGRPVGLLLGIVGTGLMGVLLLYSVRKWLPFTGFMGSNQFWMRFHLVCGLLGPLYILLHAEAKAPQGFIAIGFYAMLAVAGSGFFGRYFFGYFPQTAADLKSRIETANVRLGELRAQLVAETRDAKSAQMARAVALAGELKFEPRTLGELMVLDAEVRRRVDLVRIMLYRARLPGDVRRRAEKTLVAQLEIRRNMAGHDVARRLLKYWNLFHQPLALAMYLIVAVHILNAIIFGGSLTVLFGGMF